MVPLHDLRFLLFHFALLLFDSFQEFSSVRLEHASVFYRLSSELYLSQIELVQWVPVSLFREQISF